MKLRHLAISLFGFIGFVLVNARYELMPWYYFLFVGAVVALTVVVHLLTKDAGTGFVGSRKGISPSEAIESVQDYLEKREDTVKLDLSNREDRTEDTMPVKIDGEEKLMYSIIAREEDVQSKAYTELVRVIWNCTDDEFWTYNGRVPSDQKFNPWFDKEKWAKHEGYRAKQNQSSGQGYIHIDQRSSGPGEAQGGQ
ncbi:hypothetical protein G3I44_14390 [Halogeometricum borinquense]|uniref:Uncharacterized protein n=1 Tax=Halogeometricum borinquense TaxID=60847 RepID=A0A6C0UIV8_9EURY|nr:hypothetical protein [Halogeometricum borinquense]QIB75375.1 hypothetical protein G3I44_14390 [Halogeometricum borinquense]